MHIFYNLRNFILAVTMCTFVCWFFPRIRRVLAASSRPPHVPDRLQSAAAGHWPLHAGSAALAAGRLLTGYGWRWPAWPGC